MGRGRVREGGASCGRDERKRQGWGQKPRARTRAGPDAEVQVGDKGKTRLER